MLLLLRPHVVAKILFWRIVGKRLRAKYRLEETVAALPFATERRMARDGNTDLAKLSVHSESKRGSIGVHLHISQDDDEEQLSRAVRALAKQSHSPVTTWVTHEEGKADHFSDDPGVTVLEGAFASRAKGLHATLKAASNKGVEWVVPTLPAITLARQAIAAFAANIDAVPKFDEVAILYGDQGERSPWYSPSRYWLKPQFDHRMLLSQDYVTAACALHVEKALSVWSISDSERFSSLYEVALALSQRNGAAHLSRVIAQTPPQHWREADERHLHALERSVGDRAEVATGPFGTAQIRWNLPERLPTVSVIVATRDRVELLRTCVEGVLNATDYPALDLIIADNESVDPETLRYMDEISTDPRVEVARWPHPFNYSAINNFAATHAKGDFLCLLNNDIEIIDSNWLTEMMREACQPNVGAVGARLLYPDRSIQHAGVAIGIGNAAGHAHRGLAEGDPGYYAQALIARGASAVTGACLLVAKDNFDKVGGLDEKELAVAYNDVDLCLKLSKLGLQNVYTPLATLIHHESKSRGLDFAPEHLARYMQELETFQDRWDTKSVTDPWHHIFLDRSRETYSV